MKPVVTHLSRLGAFLVAAFAIQASQTACITVNVNFPESAVQQATDDYVRDLYRVKRKTEAHPAPAASPSASSQWLRFALVPEARADEGADVSFQITVDTPDARAIEARQAARLGDVDAQKAAGNLGESSEGKLVLRGQALSPLLKKKVEKLLEDENHDRKALYKEVQSANHIASRNLGRVAESFARSFQANSPAGTWVQSPGGTWSRKE